MPLTPYTVTKDESDDRFFLADFSGFPEVRAGRTVSSCTISGGSGLTIGTPAVLTAEEDGIAAGKGVSVRISGGTAGTTYTFEFRGTLSNGSVVVVPAALSVV